ncbi:glutaredoxin family protein [Bacillus sp. 1P06AnD]|uniref:glutaredoxin family protein n=1 Tax=Bacillus sp. 1P06AnD TaxID=3132208 RepID=UPI00399F9333
MNDVTVYTTNTCPYCTMMKNFLDENQISYNEVNVSKHPEQMQQLVNTTGQMGVPQTQINGHWVLGFDPATAMQYLRK